MSKPQPQKRSADAKSHENWVRSPEGRISMVAEIIVTVDSMLQDLTFGEAASAIEGAAAKLRARKRLSELHSIQGTSSVRTDRVTIEVVDFGWPIAS